MVTWDQLKGTLLRRAVLQTLEKPLNRKVRMRIWKISIQNELVFIHIISTIRQDDEINVWNVISRGTIFKIPSNICVFLWKYGEPHLYFSHQGDAYTISLQRLRKQSIA